MEPLDHAYTNRTSGDGCIVVKEFIGPEAAARRDREEACLRALRGLVPVPEVLGVSGLELSTRFVAGVHGKDLLASGQADAVLAACGETLHRIQQIDPLTVFEEAAPSQVVVHGDYGPNNLLLDPLTMTVAAVVDWEWAHPGGAVEDVAGCEWIVRTFHPRQVDALTEFFTAYGQRPSWEARQAAMIAKCRRLLDFAQTRDPDGPTVEVRRRQLVETESWHE